MMKKLFLVVASLFILSITYSQKRNTSLIFKTESKVIYGICFTNKGETLAIADNNTIKVFSTNSRELLYEFTDGHKSQILSIDISKDSTLMVSGGKDSTIVIWDFINKKILKSLTYQKGIVTSVKLSPDRRYLASGGTDDMVYLYDLEKNEILHEFSDHTDDITSVAFSPDGNMLATAGGDKTIIIYDVKNNKLLASLTGHKSWVRDISFNGNGEKLISCGDDSRIITWNIADRNRIRKQEDSKFGLSWFLSIAFNIDCVTYVSGGMDGKVKIVGQYGEYITKVGVPVNKVLFKPNEGNYLKIALATRGKGAMLIDVRNMKLKKN
jgi:WD40 repeat protein